MGKQISKMKKRKQEKSDPSTSSSEMASEINDRVGLLSLPQEVIHHLAKFLEPRELLALTRTCHSLRVFLNDDSIWRKYSHGDTLSKSLCDVPSVVFPIFSEPDEHCDHWLRVLRLTRLLRNFRQGISVELSIHVKDKLYSLAMGEDKNIRYRNFKWIRSRQTIYKNKYLLALTHTDEMQTVEVFKINETLSWISSVVLSKDGTNPDFWYLSIHVIEDLLIAHSIAFFSIYKISPPDCTITYAHTIYCPYDPPLGLGRTSSSIVRFANVGSSYLQIVGHYIFYSPQLGPVVKVWDLLNGKQLEPIYPKVDGVNFRAVRFSSSEKYMLLSVGLDYNRELDAYLFVYDIESRKYTEFCVMLEPYFSRTDDGSGLIDDSHVVFITEATESQIDTPPVCVYVFDLHTSALLAQKKGVEQFQGCPHIINEVLVLLASKSVKVMSLRNCDTICEIKIGDYSWAQLITLPNSAINLMAVAKSDDVIEIWDLENRTKCFDLQSLVHANVDVTSSKMLVTSANLRTVRLVPGLGQLIFHRVGLVPFVGYKQRGERTVRVFNFW